MDAEAEAPIFGPPDAKSESLERTLMLGKVEGRRRRGRQKWLDLLAVQGTLKSLLQHHSSKTLILWHSAFFIIQLSYPYMTTGKTIALTRQTFVGKVKSLAFNMLSRFFITFLPRSTGLFISCHHLQ